MDTAAFEALYADCWRAVLAYALRRTDCPGDAADVAAEVFAVAWRRRADVPPGDAGRLWLYGVARRILANHRRGELRRARLGAALRAEVERLAPDPAREVAAADDVRAVGRALRRLPEVDRELVMLTAWDGLRPAEAAAVVGISATAARVRLHRARRRIRDTVDGTQRQREPGHVTGDGRSPVPTGETSW